MARKSARKSTRKSTRKSAARPASRSDKSERERIIDAFMALLAEKPIERIGFAEIAKAAGVSLADLRGTFASTLAILAAHMKAIDRAVLAGGDADMDEEPPRERLFDVLMGRNPGLALALNSLAVRSQQWMLTAADIGASGPRGLLRAQGLALLFASVLRTWTHDEDEGLAPTMAALDRALARGQRWSGFLDDLFRIPASACRLRPRRRGRRGRRDTDEDTVAA
jgi:AcrR family transcriptional regulator